MSCSQPRDTGCDEKQILVCVEEKNKKQNDGITAVFVDDWAFLSGAVCFNRPL